MAEETETRLAGAPGVPVDTTDPAHVPAATVAPPAWALEAEAAALVVAVGVGAGKPAQFALEFMGVTT